MKYLFIVNPTAGGHDATDEIRARAEQTFRSRPESYEVYVTRGPRDATRKICEEAESGEELRVYACGGDGTFNECVCGAALKTNVAVCPFPTGTGNDFCRMFGRDAARFRDLNAVVNGSIHPIDLISCNGSYSANICSVGIDARIGTDVHKYTGIPVIGGAGAYVISAVVNAVHGIATEMRIRCGGRSFSGKHTLVCICNGRFYGGGFNPSTGALLDDGILDIYIAKKVSLFNFARLIGMYAKGRVDELPQYATHMRETEIEIDFDREDVVNLDGEALYTSAVRIRLLPKAMNLILPEGMPIGSENFPISASR
ncbi:MAG: YegS/Rv2252/BmrU family lipid kinase [Oscillospiraceae bacterium]|nr:YegS/Rv2252/BmrU family lipid kinase [Oscillospiraceae bacterium]